MPDERNWKTVQESIQADLAAMRTCIRRGTKEISVGCGHGQVAEPSWNGAD